MKMTLKNKNLIKIKKMFKEAEKLEYVPHTIEVTKDELKEIVNELCFFKNKHYSLVYRDRRGDGNGEGITSSMNSVFLQHKPNEVYDILVNNTGTLVYRDTINFVIKDKANEVSDGVHKEPQAE